VEHRKRLNYGHVNNPGIKAFAFIYLSKNSWQWQPIREFILKVLRNLAAVANFLATISNERVNSSGKSVCFYFFQKIVGSGS